MHIGGDLLIVEKTLTKKQFPNRLDAILLSHYDCILLDTQHNEEIVSCANKFLAVENDSTFSINYFFYLNELKS